LKEYIEAEDADIVCLQETKLNEPNYSLFFKKQYPFQYFSCCDTKKGYSGTMVLSKQEPEKIKYGIGWKHNELSKEGRVISLQFSKFWLVACYIPNAGQKLERLSLRQEWDKEMKRYLEELQQEKPVVWCGDLNVSHQEIDLARPATNHRTAGFTDEERDGFSHILQSHFIDTYRAKHPDSKSDCYTYFSYRFSCRTKNIGWRLDYFVVSESLMDDVVESTIRRECYGASDHLPIVLILNK
jgi:exodeoxyribonuclease III